MDQDYAAYLERLLQGDFEGCSTIVDGLLDSGHSVQEVYEDLFARSLYEVGNLWETNRISVAKEHLATAVTERLMGRLAPQIFGGRHLDRSAIVCCPADEIHQVGGRMVADTLEMNGWHAHFLGANTPLQDLVKMVEEKTPDLLALSVAMPFNLPRLEMAIGKVREAKRDLPIVLGGQAFRHGGRDFSSNYPDVTLMESLAELESFIQGR